MDGGEDDGLHDGLAEEGSESGFDGWGASRGRSAPAPFVVMQYPEVQLEDCSALSQTEVVLTLFVNLLGVGVLAAPSALASAGLVSGVLVLLCVAAASRQGLLMLLDLGTVVASDRPYLELGKLAFGPQGLAAVLMVHLLYSGGLLTACIATLADLFVQLGATLFGFTGLPRWAFVFVAAGLCTPGALMHSLQNSSLLSGACAAGAILFVLALPLYCVADLLPSWFPGAPIDPGGIAEEVTYGSAGFSGFFIAARIFVLQFSVHAGAIEAFGTAGCRSALGEDMHEAGGSGEHGRPYGAEEVSLRAFMGSAPLIAAIAAVGYLRYGEHVAGNILVSLNADKNGASIADGTLDKVFALVKVAYAAVLIASSAFVAAPCRSTAIELFLVRRSAGGPSTKTFRRATVCVLLVCAFLAWLVTDLACLLGFLGAWAAGPLVFILPSAIAIELARQRDGRPYLSPSNAMPMLLLFLGGVLALSSLCWFLGFALTYPAGHRGHRITTTNLANIATNPTTQR